MNPYALTVAPKLITAVMSPSMRIELAVFIVGSPLRGLLDEASVVPSDIHQQETELAQERTLEGLLERGFEADALDCRSATN